MTSDPRELPGIDPDMAAAMIKGRELLPEGPGDVGTLPIGEIRARYLKSRVYWNEDGPAMDHTVDMRVDGPEGAIPVRLYYPSAGDGQSCLVYFHGGGFVKGSIETHDKICRWLAKRADVVVCSVDYRLAPEFRFPVPLEEAKAVLAWLAREGRDLGIDPYCLGLGGDSAGASISLGTALDLRSTDPDLFGRLRVLLLFYGSYGLAPESESARAYSDPAYGLSAKDRRFFRTCYVADPETEPEKHRDPRLRQLDADLSGLPPCVVAAAELDPLCDDSPALAERLQAAGVPHTLRIYTGVVHGFLHMTRMVPKARQALDDAGVAVARAFAEEGMIASAG